tara:strand:+ start:317 stop:583 length:267 start_codon:yes stop_codon:yes gene_type:complete
MRWKNENLSDLSQMINGLMSSFSVVKEELKNIKTFKQDRRNSENQKFNSEDFEFLLKRVENLALKIEQMQSEIKNIKKSEEKKGSKQK